ncbi:hypothetical protein AVEN_167468-1 [Araneus ventricosus]|uniref:Uncharacterized protein n=1 Tax=Araneus ventricosus TaxID=182803 RepID=A0A4Y2ICA9_ARAVE|nr:hypothetical protein AVEN_167468-1 [Araneus ventricosus]
MLGHFFSKYRYSDPRLKRTSSYLERVGPLRFRYNGLSWIFGFLAAIEGTKLVFQYLFVMTTTLQGFLFFSFFVLRQKKTRELWQNLVKSSPTSVSSEPIGMKKFSLA